MVNFTDLVTLSAPTYGCWRMAANGFRLSKLRPTIPGLGASRVWAIPNPIHNWSAIFRLSPAQVCAGTGIHPDCLTFLDKQRRLNRFSCLQLYGLLDIRCAIPTKTLGRFNNFEND